jgi:Dehydrogenase E1 component
VVLAMGAPLDRAFGEILGRAGGLCRGKGGSMHLADLSVGALGSNAIVGGHLPMTVGVALAHQYLGNSAVSVAFFGDGAANIGAFHESCSLAAVWQLPAIFVLENNHYGEYSPLVTVRLSNGSGAGFAAQHSQPAENWFLNVSGLKIAVPGTVADLYGLLRSAVRDPRTDVAARRRSGGSGGRQLGGVTHCARRHQPFLPPRRAASARRSRRDTGPLRRLHGGGMGAIGRADRSGRETSRVVLRRRTTFSEKGKDRRHAA